MPPQIKQHDLEFCIVMDNCNTDNSPRPNPPGSSDFVFRYIDATHDGGMGTISTLGMGTISTLTDPPPIQSPVDGPNISIHPPPIKSLPEKHCVISSLTPNSPTWTIDNYMLESCQMGTYVQTHYHKFPLSRVLVLPQLPARTAYQVTSESP